ncbi:17053_t:CDS:2 [Funneliformis geosporum]|nr:17053_t:CDS:2 [Funneliformis geosporum]
MDLIHRDIHSGNILFFKNNESSYQWQIGDLGLSQPANNTSLNNEIYGVIPYIAPEIFNGAPFTKASDVYAMAMIMWELTTGCKPFANIKHDTHLIFEIIDGKRPVITNDTPECFADLMRRCWYSDPLKRPSIKEFRITVGGWYNRGKNKEQFKQADVNRLKLINSRELGPELSVMHPNAVFTSRSLPLISSLSSINSLNIQQDDEFEILMQEVNNKEYEFDIDTQRLLMNVSTSQNSSITQHPSKSIGALISTENSSRKRKIKELETKLQVDSK